VSFHRMHRLTTQAFRGVLAGLLAASASASAQRAAGSSGARTVVLVLRVEGAWTIRDPSLSPPRQPVQVGRGLTAHDTLVADDPRSANSRITLLYSDGRREVRQCGPSNPSCSGPPRLVSKAAANGEGAEQRGLLRALFAAVLESMHEHPSRYASMISRGMGEPGDGVLLFHDGRLDLAPTGISAEPAPRRVTFVAARDTSAAADDSGLVLATLDSGAVSLRVPALAPGLYVLTLEEPGEPSGPRVTAWVLVSGDSSRFARLTRRYADATSVTAGWFTTGGQRRAALRAYLARLATEELQSSERK
jgi:hypothetical protein